MKYTEIDFGKSNTVDIPNFTVRGLGNGIHLIEYFSTDTMLQHLHILRDHYLGMEYSVLEKHMLITDIGLTTLQYYLE